MLEMHALCAPWSQDDMVNPVPSLSSLAPAGPWSVDLREASPGSRRDNAASHVFALPGDALDVFRFGLAMIVAGLTVVWVASVQHSREIRMAFLVDAIGIMAFLAIELHA